MNKKSFAVLVIVCAGILVWLVLADVYFSSAEVSEFDMHLIVGDVIGFNIDNDKLWFGIVPPGSEGVRHIDLSNNYDYPVKVKVSSHGELRPWIFVSENNFVLEPNETKSIDVIANVPSDLEKDYSVYEGKLKVAFYPAFNLFGEAF